MKTTITIQGTHCAACKALIEDVVAEFPRVQTCTVDFKTGKTDIEHDEHLNWNNLKHEIESLGKYTFDIPTITYVVCPVCGLRYEEKTWAEQCETWCTKHNSCNLEIAKHAAK